MKVDVRVGGCNVLASGSFLVPANINEAFLDIEDLEIKFVFTKDESKTTKIQATGKDKRLVLHMNAHSNAFRNGLTAKFVEIATLGDDPVSITYTVQGINSGAKIVHYTLVKGDAECGDSDE